MKKKKLKKQIKTLIFRVNSLERNTRECLHCENFKPKTVTFRRFEPLPSIKPLAEGERYPDASKLTVKTIKAEDVT